MKTLVLEVNRPSALHLPPAASELKHETKGLMLMPGENTVSEGYWAKVKENPAVKIWLRAGILKKIRMGEATPIDVNWGKITVEKAGAILEKIDSIESLQKIKGLAKKKSIKDLCALRIDELLEESEKANG